MHGCLIKISLKVGFLTDMLDMQQSLFSQFNKFALNQFIHVETTTKANGTEGEWVTIVSHLIESWCYEDEAPVDGSNEV